MFSSVKKNNLIGFKVFTQSDIELGAVSDVEIDKQSGVLNALFVKKIIFIIPLGRPLIINRSQIVQIIEAEQKIIVEDGVVKIKGEEKIYSAERI